MQLRKQYIQSGRILNSQHGTKINMPGCGKSTLIQIKLKKSATAPDMKEGLGFVKTDNSTLGR